MDGPTLAALQRLWWRSLAAGMLTWTDPQLADSLRAYLYLIRRAEGAKAVAREVELLLDTCNTATSDALVTFQAELHAKYGV